MKIDQPTAPSQVHVLRPADTHTPQVKAPASPDTLRTLFDRAGTDPKPVDAKTQARRARLLSHAERSAHRRQALLELFRGGTLPEAASVDPQLHRDAMRLINFVKSDIEPGDSRP